MDEQQKLLKTPKLIRTYVGNVRNVLVLTHVKYSWIRFLTEVTQINYSPPGSTFIPFELIAAHSEAQTQNKTAVHLK
jgi:hypothetical protein